VRARSGGLVRCERPEFALQNHTGYVLRDTDRHDVAVLCERFGLQSPENYRWVPRRGNPSHRFGRDACEAPTGGGEKPVDGAVGSKLNGDRGLARSALRNHSRFSPSPNTRCTAAVRLETAKRA
jgi:hypothetical protein